MKTLNITDEQISRAKIRYEFGELNGSITKGKSNLIGAIGEIVIIDYYNDIGLSVVDEPTYDYDLIIESKKFDIKSKKITSPPKEYYLCSISNFNTTQQCDYYLFVRIDVDNKLAYLLGYIKKDEYYEKSYFKRKGELDETCHYEWRFKDDCWNLEISKLHKLKE